MLKPGKLKPADKAKEAQKAEKKKIRKAVMKGIGSTIKSTIFPDKETRRIKKQTRQEKRELVKEFGFKKGGSIRTKKK